jgi:hypothetical protein
VCLDGLEVLVSMVTVIQSRSSAMLRKLPENDGSSFTTQDMQDDPLSRAGVLKPLESDAPVLRLAVATHKRGRA